jgi:hypothetical protein
MNSLPSRQGKNRRVILIVQRLGVLQALILTGQNHCD